MDPTKPGDLQLPKEAEDDLLVAFDAAVAADDGFRIPAVVLDAELAGRHPVGAWREHRGQSTTALAQATGISEDHLLRIERREFVGEPAMYVAIAAALEVPLDLIVEQ